MDEMVARTRYGCLILVNKLEIRRRLAEMKWLIGRAVHVQLTAEGQTSSAMEAENLIGGAGMFCDVFTCGSFRHARLLFMTKLFS